MITSNLDQGSCSEGETIPPNTFKGAVNSLQVDKWRAAAHKEIDSLKRPKVYELIPAISVPSRAKTIESGWVFKLNADDSYKVRLVVQGWGQQPGVDCEGTFEPVHRLQTYLYGTRDGCGKGLEYSAARRD